MTKPTTTELSWKLEAMERKLTATTDLVVFMAAHLADASPQHAEPLVQQLHELQQIDGVSWNQEFSSLIQRLRKALEQEDLPLDSKR